MTKQVPLTTRRTAAAEPMLRSVLRPPMGTEFTIRPLTRGEVRFLRTAGAATALPTDQP